MRSETELLELLEGLGAELRGAQWALDEARDLLNATVVEAREAGVTATKVMAAVGWKQRKSVRDAIAAHQRKQEENR